MFASVFAHGEYETNGMDENLTDKFLSSYIFSNMSSACQSVLHISKCGTPMQGTKTTREQTKVETSPSAHELKHPPGLTNRGALCLCHRLGVHMTWEVIGTLIWWAMEEGGWLRSALNKSISSKSTKGRDSVLTSF